MWIGDVDIPEDLVEAARAGKLVVFVGAGASRDAPSSLPDFGQLTTAILAETSTTFDAKELDFPDFLLGRLGDAGVDVHQRVRAHIDAPDSAPNALHEAIVDLTLATGIPRIVTTNYDTHLSEIIEARDLGWHEYVAPALPMGDDFVGIVYLHGSLRQESRHLIVTAADFGRAYLRDAWAARFLERMFASFSVLFVGYSHSDTVMRYLGRSLGQQSSRYVLTPKPDAEEWRQLNIRPVAYQVRDSSHAMLTEAISRWARQSSMGLLDHRQQIAKLVAAPPSSVPEEQSYLDAVIGNDQRVTLFTDLAQGRDWLVWAVSRPEGRAIFDPSADQTATTWALATWFARQCLGDEATSNVGLGILSEAGGRMSTALWNAVGQQLHVKSSPREGWLRPWIILMVENAPLEGRHWLEYALTGSTFPEDRDVALVLFDHLTEPHIVVKPSLGLSERVRFDIELRSEEYWLRDSWAKVLQPNLPEIVGDVLALADRHLRRAHQLLVAAEAAKPGWDPVSLGRSSIAPHEQDRHGDKIGVVVDAAREGLELLVATDARSATGVIDRWSASEIPLLRRVAIHGVAVDAARTGSEKLAWLLDRGWLFDLLLKHEVFELLAAALPSADDAIVDRLVADAASGPVRVTDEDIREYEAFNALGWIDRHSTAPSARAAFAQAQADHPTFGVRDHPDFSTWFGGVSSGYTAPMPVEEFHALLQGDRSAALEKLAEFRKSQFAIDRPTWDDAVSLVRQVVQDHPEDGLVLLGTENDLDKELIGAVVRSWTVAKLDDDSAPSAIDRLSALDLNEWGHDLAGLLAGHGDTEGRTEWHRFGAARELARTIARSGASNPNLSDERNWLEKAINAPGGLLAEFWMRVISYEWKADQAAWAGLSAESRDAIEELLQRGAAPSALTEVILASQLHFLFAADREWCEANVLPLLAWDDPDRARRTWDGFLYWGRWSDEMLQAGLLDHYLAAARHFEGFPDEIGRQFTDHLAAIALYSESDPGTWLPRFTSTASDRLRVEWINHVAWALDRLDADLLKGQWDRWMRDYWAKRLNSIPLSLMFEEATALAGWVVKLNDEIDEAVDLAVAAPAGLAQHGNVLHDLSERAERAPAAYARLLGHLLAGTNPPFWECHYLPRIVAAVRESADDGDIRRIREHGLRLGCAGAADW